MKTFKKVLASALAAAMVVTAFPVTNAEAATKAKLSATKATVYAGQVKTIKVTAPAGATVKATKSNSNIKIAYSKKTKTLKVRGVKAGTAKVTVKVTGKAVKKTLKATITVKNSSLTVSADKTNLIVGDTTQLTVKKTPSSATVKYSSSDAAVVTVSGGKVKAVGAGTAYVTVNFTYGSKKITKKIKFVVEAAKEGLTTSLGNQFSADYANTVLVNDSAIVNVAYTKDGKPVSGQTVVLTITGGQGAHKSNYEVKDNVATTNTNGIATFVIKNKQTDVKSSSTEEVASINYKASLPADASEVEGTVNFAAITNTKITNVNAHNLVITDNLVPGTNYNGGRNGLAVTSSMNAPSANNVEYVESQQVSSEGSSEHAVTMTGGYPVITLPGSAAEDTNASKMTDELNHSSGKYYTYANDSYYYELKEDPSKLTYATLNFDKVTLSKYTRLVVETFANKTNAEKSKNPGTAHNGSIDQKVYDGEMTQPSIGYQIPLDNHYAGLCVKVTLLSEGQVDAAKNDGYTAKNVVYVYKTSKTSAGDTVALKNASVSWSVVDTPYTAETDVTASATSYGVTLNSDETLTSKVPVFPYTGTAVLTKYDANKKVLGYYAIATVNNGKNQNVIESGVNAYQISADELRDKVGEITAQDGTNVTIDSKKAGRTTLEGTVKVNGKVVEDAELASVYTSVQWNPIPKAADATAASDGFVALLGQKIEVVAQLTDKNGNAVSAKDQGVKFSIAGTDLAANTTKVNGAKGTATVVNTITDKTDANGQTKLVLKASTITEVLNVEAKSADSQYDVKLVIAGKDTKKADLYWIDANLTFTDKVGGTPVTTDALNPVKDTTGMDVKPKTGTTWIYGVKPVGVTATYGALKDKAIEINGLGITMSKTVASVGTIETLADVKGSVQATSTKGGDMDIVSKLDSSTLTNNVTVSNGTFAGTGTTSISKKLTIKVKWEAAGMTASYVVPTGTRVVSGSSVTAYLKVTDNYGNVQPGKTVKFKFDDGNADVNNATTDQNGIAKASFTYKSAATTTVSATVDGLGNETFDQTFVWVDDSASVNISKAEGVDSYVTNYDKDKKTVTLTFNEDIVESSVIKNMFTVTYKPYSGSNVQLVVKSVAVNGNVVTLTLADVPSLTDARDTVEVVVGTPTVESVDYKLTAINGANYTKTVTIHLDGTTKPEEV